MAGRRAHERRGLLPGRVPVEFVFDFLANGTMDEFYEDYTNIKPEQLRAVIEAFKELIEGAFRVAA